MGIQPVPMVPSHPQPIIPIQPLISQIPTMPTNGTNGLLINEPLVNTGVAPILDSGIPKANPLPAPPTPPSGTQSRSMSVSEKAPSIESPGALPTSTSMEWGVKGPSKLRYTQLFNTTDRMRTGFLTGAQARNLMVLSKLPQTALAQIWALADLDSDGRLGCEEFVLAMYLCEIAAQGEPIPKKLPPELVPPTFRKSTPSRHASGPSSRHGSVSSQGGAAQTADIDSLHNYSQNSFEDKRKENFDKGQAELDRRRKVLQGKYFGTKLRNDELKK